MNPKFTQRPEPPFMLLGAVEIEQYKRLEQVLASALLLVQDPRFERELLTPGKFRDLAASVRNFLVVQDEKSGI